MWVLETQPETGEAERVVRRRAEASSGTRHPGWGGTVSWMWQAQGIHVVLAEGPLSQGQRFVGTLQDVLIETGCVAPTAVCFCAGNVFLAHLLTQAQCHLCPLCRH